MKKSLLIILLCICFVCVGCSSGEAGLILNSDGSVVEYYYIPFPEESLIANGVSIQTIRGEILPQAKVELDSVFSSCLTTYRNVVQNSTEYTEDEKTYLLNGVAILSNLPSNLSSVMGNYTTIKYEIHYADSTCFNIFKDINPSLKEDKEVQTINNFFTITTKVVKDPIFDKIASGAVTLGTACVNRTNQIMEQALGSELWEEIKQDLNYASYANKFNYSYVVPTARVHSNASKVEKSAEGYYYHTWEINLNNLDENGNSQVQIQYWTTTANKPVWYAFSLVVAGGIITTVILVAKRKEKQEQQKFKVEE